jgi:hypothetical protein
MDFLDFSFNRAEPVKDCMSRQYPREAFYREVLKAYIKEFIKKNYALPVVKRTLVRPIDTLK